MKPWLWLSSLQLPGIFILSASTLDVQCHQFYSEKKLYSSTNQFKAYYVALWADKEYSKNLKSLISPSRNRIHRWPPCQGSSPGSSRPHWLLTSLCSNLLCMGYARAHCLQVQQKVNPPIQYYQSCPFHRMKSQSHMDFNHSVKQSVGF